MCSLWPLLILCTFFIIHTDDFIHTKLTSHTHTFYLSVEAFFLLCHRAAQDHGAQGRHCDEDDDDDGHLCPLLANCHGPQDLQLVACLTKWKIMQHRTSAVSYRVVVVCCCCLVFLYLL